MKGATPRKRGSDKHIFIYGKHAVNEALQKRRDAVRGVWFADGFSDGEIIARVKKNDIRAGVINPRRLPGDLPQEAVHQGVIASMDAGAITMPYRDFIADLEVTPDTALVVLGEVQDPHNVGAVIRSAAAFGVAGVLIPPHRQATLSGTVLKVSAGTAFTFPVVEIPNVNTAVKDLKDKGFWIYGLDGGGAASLHTETFPRPSAFVLGNESTGLREKTRDACDEILQIPIHQRAESLNAAAAAATVLYAWSAKHPNALE